MKVVIYTTASCPHCKALIDYFNERHIDYQEKNVSTDLNARMTLIKRKILAVPTICIDDEEWIVGFNQVALDKTFDPHH